MKLLFLSHRLPCPPHKGEKIRALNMLGFLARHHEIHLASLVDDAADLEHRSLLEPHIRSLVFERIHPRLRRPLALTALLGTHSVSSAYFHSSAMQRRVDDLIERERIEALFCSCSPMAEYVFRSRHAQRLRRLPKIMDLIDVDSIKWRDYAEASGPWIRWLYRREAECLSTLEERIGREFDRLLVVSEAERRCCPPAIDRARIMAVSNGVDFEYFSPGRVSPSPEARPTLVFTGVMDYRPNVEGICWFVERVLPRVRAAVPQAHLYIVGNRPAKPVRRLDGSLGVTVTGFVPDVRGYLSMATACVAPLRIARGIQNKVLEAMAMGRPVVATPQAFEGIDAQPGRDLLVAASEDEFAEHVIGLLQDPRRAARIGANARARIELRYSWAANLRLLDDLLPADGPGGASDAPVGRERRPLGIPQPGMTPRIS